MLRAAVLRYSLIIICFAAYAAPQQAHAAASADAARQYVDTVGKQVLEALNSNMSQAQKHQKLEQMFADNVDMDWMGRFVLGRGWAQASDAQRTSYLQAYRQYLLARYTSKFSDYTGSNYTIGDAKSDGDGQFTVAMHIKTPNQQQDVNAGYRLRADSNGQFKIIDIIIEGVSLITTQRADFASTLQQKGMDALIGDLQQKAQGEQQK